MYNPYAEAVGQEDPTLQHPQPRHVHRYSQDGGQGYQKQNQHSQGYSNQGYSNQGYQAQYAAQQFPAQTAQYQGQYQQMPTGQPQYQQPGQGQYQQPGQGYQQAPAQGHYQPNAAYGEFFKDPAASMAAQFAKSSLGQSNTYLQQNFGLYMPVAGELKYYFKVSNAYAWRKLALILFPYRHKDWQRILAVDQGGAAAASLFMPACDDINAPDLYIPLMSFVTYILLWALLLGLRGDFHPEVFGYLASQTLACLFLDILIFRVGLYLLNCLTQSSFWDLVAFSGYKYVTITALLCAKQLLGGLALAYYSVLLMAVASLSLFLMRSLKFLILPTSMGDSASQTILNSQRRIRVQFLFIYSVVVQLLIVFFMCR